MSKRTVELELIQGTLFDASGNIINGDTINKDKDRVNYKVINSTDNLATGIVANQYAKTSTDFLTDLKDYSSLSNIYRQIELANKIFLLEGSVSTSIDIFVDFVITPFEIEGISDNLKPVFDAWKDNVNKNRKFYEPFGLKKVAEDLAFEWFISGNCFPWEVWEDVDIEGRTAKLPVKLKLLNPRAIRVDKTSFEMGDPKYILSPGLVSSKLSLDDFITEIKLGANKTGESNLFKNINLTDNQMELPNNFLSHIKRRARDYEIWGKPYLTKVVQAVAYKQKLVRLDMQTVEGLINMITVFKIGSENKDSPYHKVTAARLKAFSALIKNPQAATTLVWPHDIDVITTGPDGSILDFSDKYNEANLNIVRGLGIPLILVDGSGSAGASWVAIMALVERLEKVREEISNYLQFILEKICVANEYTDCKPRIRWAPTKLRDEKTIKTLLLAFYDRGLLPIKVMHEEGRYNHDEMVTIKEFEIDNNLEETFMRPNIPFTTPPGGPMNPDPGGNGRPLDRVNTGDPSTFKEGRASHFTLPNSNIQQGIADKYRDDTVKIVNDLQESVLNLKRRTRSKVELQIAAAFMRIEQVSKIFSEFDDVEIDSEFDLKLNRFHGENLDRLKKFIISNTMKIARRKVDEDEKEIFIRGIFSTVTKRVELFVKESLKFIDFVKILSSEKRKDIAGAILHTKPSNCEFCSEIDGNFMTLSEMSEKLFFHPHQNISFEFVSKNPILDGKKNKIAIQNPKNKTTKL